MRALVQRVSAAKVEVEGEIVGEISAGLLIFLGVGLGDADVDAVWLAEKVAHLRIFTDAQGKMNLSLLGIGGAALVVSQFTLYGDARKGRRPSFTGAAEPEEANRLYVLFCDLLAGYGIYTARGVFQAHMAVTLTNDGPVTLMLETPER